MKKAILMMGISFFAGHCTAQDKSHFILWYDQPAKEWNEALPIGNGRLGAMVFGRADSELIQLNELEVMH